MVDGENVADKDDRMVSFHVVGLVACVHYANKGGLKRQR